MPKDTNAPTNAEQERWQDVPGFFGYQVSDFGRVRSCRIAGGRGERVSSFWHIIRPQTLPSGYQYVGMRRNGTSLHKYVHRLVLEAFVGPCPAGGEARHIRTKDRANNYLTNLSWGTSLENSADMVQHGTRPFGEQVHSAKLSEPEIAEILSAAADGEEIRSLAVRFGIRTENLSKIVNGHHWPHVFGPRKLRASQFPGYLTSKEAATILGLTRARVQQLVKTGVLRAVRCRTGLMIEPASVTAAVGRSRSWKRAARKLG